MIWLFRCSEARQAPVSSFALWEKHEVRRSTSMFTPTLQTPGKPPGFARLLQKARYMPGAPSRGRYAGSVATRPVRRLAERPRQQDRSTRRTRCRVRQSNRRHRHDHCAGSGWRFASLGRLRSLNERLPGSARWPDSGLLECADASVVGREPYRRTTCRRCKRL